MPINPLISLQTQVPDVGKAFTNALLNVQRIDQLKNAPTRAKLLEAQAQTAQAAVPTDTEQANQAQINKIKSVATAARQFLPDLQAGNIDRVMTALQARDASLVEAGIPNAETQESMQLLQTNPDELIRISNDMIALDDQLTLGTQGAASQFGAQSTFKDTAGNLFFGTTKRNPQTGTVESVLAPIGNAPAQPVGQVSFVSQLGQTAAEKQATTVSTAEQTERAKQEIKQEIEPITAATKAATTQAIKKSGDAFDKIEKIKTNIANYDEAINLIDQGAETGSVTSLFPSFRAATVQLDNLQSRLGLDVIGSTTFGALSESELKFALDTALPKKLKGQDLRRWVVRKKEAQQKLSGYIAEYANFLGTPGNTLADWNQLQTVRQIESETPPTQVIRFDAQGNVIQ